MSAMLDPPILLGTRDAAARLGISEHSVRRLVHTGRLPARRLYPGARWRIPLDAVEALLEPEPRKEAA
jgi:excisionase family DNA binding protein